jgi:hypothetical protein
MKFRNHFFGAIFATALVSVGLHWPIYATTYSEVVQKCPVGGEKFNALEVGSSTSWGQRPDGRDYGTLPIWPLKVCPKNGFVIFDDVFSSEELRQLTDAVNSPDYQALVKAGEVPHYRASWLAGRINRPIEQRAGFLMQAGWDSDDLAERKQRYQREFADLALQLDLQTAGKNENFWLSLRGVNALRELGDFEKAAVRIAALKSAKNYPTDRDEKKGADWLILGLSRLIEDRNAFSEPTNMIPADIAKERCAGIERLQGVEVEACEKNASLAKDDSVTKDLPTNELENAGAEAAIGAAKAGEAADKAAALAKKSGKRNMKRVDH